MRLTKVLVVIPFVALGAISVAKAEVLPGCADQALIGNVRNLMIVNNKLPDITLAQFSEIKTLRAVPPPYFKPRTKQAEVACSAMVGIIPDGKSDGKIVDVVEVLYGVAAKDADAYQVYFQPKRAQK